MDTLLKKYAERIELISIQPIRIRETHYEKLLLEFLLEYVELRENKKEK